MNESNDRVECANCGALNFRSSETCWQCGQTLRAQGNQQQPEQPITPPVIPQPGSAQPPPPREGGDTNIYIILGFIFAVLGLLCCPVFSLAGIVMGAIATSRGNKLGVWVIVTSVVLLVVYVLVFAAAMQGIIPGMKGLPGGQFPMPAPSPEPGPMPMPAPAPTQ